MTVELRDLVARLKPIHRKLEADLAERLRLDGELRRLVEERCQKLSKEQGVLISEDLYVHNSATVYALKGLFLKVAEDYGLFPRGGRKVAMRGDLFRYLRELGPRLTWADYLEYAIRDIAYLPMAYDLFKETGYESIPPSDEMARVLLDTVAELGDLRDLDTRALGDLYENLMDQEERKRLGYYTTPDFIIEFLLDRTLEPAVEEFGAGDLRYLDPACGTGHFLVRAYRRLDKHLAREEPDLTALERFERIMENNIFGIDISEFAIRITLFRLFLEGVHLAQREGKDVNTWGEDIAFNVYTANSLIKWPQEMEQPSLVEISVPPRRQEDPVARYYRRGLTHLRVDLGDVVTKGFHVVNANPPYVRIHKQEAEVVAPINGNWQIVDFVQYLRDKYDTTHSQFDLSVPFVERGLQLLVPGGYLGYITTGKFAKQAYGKKLAQLVASKRYLLLFFADLTDGRVFEAGTYPALMILQYPGDVGAVPAEAPVEVLATYKPAAETGERSWLALRALLASNDDTFEDYAGYYREQQGHFRSHPWTLRRSQHDLLARIKEASDKTLADYAERISEDFHSNADPVFCDYITESFIRRNRLEREVCIPCLRGANIRNWTVSWHGNRKREQTYALYTLDLETDHPIDIDRYPNVKRYLARYRRYLEARTLGWNGTVVEEGLPWWTINKRNARLGVPKIEVAAIATQGHFYLDADGRYLLRHSAQAMYFREHTRVPLQALVGVLNSAVTNYVVERLASRLQHGYREFVRKSLERIPIPPADNELWNVITRKSAQVGTLVGELGGLSAYEVVRNGTFRSANQLYELSSEAVATSERVLRLLQDLQEEIDTLTAAMYAIDGPHVLEELLSDRYTRPWGEPAFYEDLHFEILDYTCDLIEDLFAAQRTLQEQPLTPAEIAAGLAKHAKFAPLRTVYYGGRPISAEQFVRECMDWDCRPIPFEQDAVLVGRKPKRVDVLHERFFRFDGVDRNLYGWTGWSAEAQADVFLSLAERAEDKMPFYRWVARLLPDIEDDDTREQLQEYLGDVEPYPYVVME